MTGGDGSFRFFASTVLLYHHCRCRFFFQLNTTTMSGNSSVGNRQVYEAGDQRNPQTSETDSRARYHEGTAHSHLHADPSMANASSQQLNSQLICYHRGPKIIRRSSGSGGETWKSYLNPKQLTRRTEASLTTTRISRDHLAQEGPNPPSEYPLLLESGKQWQLTHLTLTAGQVAWQQAFERGRDRCRNPG